MGRWNEVTARFAHPRVSKPVHHQQRPGRVHNELSHATDESAQHISYIVNQCLSGNFSTIEPSEEAEDAWVQEIISQARLSESYQASCTPGYYNNEGKPNPRSIQNATYGKGPNPFFKLMKAWREEGAMQGLELG